MSFRNVCITVNNPDLPPEIIVELSTREQEGVEASQTRPMPRPPFQPLQEWSSCSYAVYQLERSLTGTIHLQAYAEFTSSVKLATLQGLPGLGGGHFERRRGTAKQAADYCKKEDSRILGYWEFGTLSAQGKRSDLEAVKKFIDANPDFEELDLADSHFGQWVRYGPRFMEYNRLRKKKRNYPMEIEVLYGPTGTGKTRYAFETYPDAYFQPPGKWWPDYEGQETVIIDEMYGSRFPLGFFLQLTDRYPLKVEVKGGTREFTSKRIVFTSNYHPHEWYANKKSDFYWPGYDERVSTRQQVHPFRRRITKLTRFGKVDVASKDYPLESHYDSNGREELRPRGWEGRRALRRAGNHPGNLDSEK